MVIAMGGLRSYRDLDVWRLAMEIAQDIYRHTANFPSEERFGLTAQIRRAAVSLPSNIVEGYCTGGTRLWLRHLAIACGSLGEVETQLILAQKLGFGNRDTATLIYRKLQSLGKQLRILRRTLAKKLKD